MAVTCEAQAGGRGGLSAAHRGPAGAPLRAAPSPGGGPGPGLHSQAVPELGEVGGAIAELELAVGRVDETCPGAKSHRRLSFLRRFQHVFSMF